MNIKICGLLTALVALLGGSSVLATPSGTLTLVSQPGDVPGHDIIGNTLGVGGVVTTGDINDEESLESLVLTYPAENSFPSFGAGDNLPGTVTPTRVGAIFIGGATFFAELDFQTDQLGIPIEPGVYTNAEEATLGINPVGPGHPGLAVIGHSGCATITGGFAVSDATFLPDGTISSFSASFEQHCDGATPALFGTFTYNANAPTPVPEPAGYWFAAIGIAWLTFRLNQHRCSNT